MSKKTFEENGSDKDLIAQLNQLPTSIEAPDRWSQIQDAINSQVSEPQISADKKHWQPWIPVALAACVALFVLIFTLKTNDVASATHIENAPQLVKASDDAINSQFRMTLESLQQANSFYYAELGQQMEQQAHSVNPLTLKGLKSLRDAQEQYQNALVLSPNDFDLQLKLVEVYQKERKLLKRLVS